MFLSVRLASLDDVAVLQELIPLSVRALQVGYYTSEQIEGAIGTVFAVDSQLIRDGTYYVAEYDKVIVGCGGWSRRKTLFGGDQMKTKEDAELDPKCDAARIRAFFICPGWQRKGIGSEIMRRCEAAAAQAGFSRIEIVATLVGEGLYRKFGYSAIERYDVALHNGFSLPVVRMFKEAAATPNQALEPTRPAVTPFACAKVAPAGRVAHL